jgi:ribosomal protein L30/L7E
MKVLRTNRNHSVSFCKKDKSYRGSKKMMSKIVRKQFGNYVD